MRLGWLDALALNRTLSADFDAVVNNHGSPTAKAADEFARHWPVENERERRRERRSTPGGWTRQPACWSTHPVRTDWPHTLITLYQVRCNLFDGDKGSDVERDQTVVHAALGVLLHFLSESSTFPCSGSP